MSQVPTQLHPPADGQPQAPRNAVEQGIWAILNELPDPEIPVISLVDLGIIRYVDAAEDGRVEVGVSPTYTGCPATEVIHSTIAAHLRAAGHEKLTVKQVLSPPWTSDWITARGRDRLREYGIAPPAQSVSNPKHLFKQPVIHCPHCNSAQVERLSEFASTPCKALYRCQACLEPFEYFKCI